VAEARSIKLRYGDRLVVAEIPADHYLGEAGMRPVSPAVDPGAVIEKALDSPIGSPPLQQAARGARQVVVLVDDMTRPTPTDLLLPPILRRLDEAGVPKSHITVLVATGTHRPMTRDQLVKKLGAAVVREYKVVNHDYRREEDLVHMGKTASGVPITVNKLVIEADFVIGVGNIVPHRYCGWSGGAKIIQPGVGGEATTYGTHLMITKDPEIRLGSLENRVRQEIEAVAERTNLKFIVNTVLDRQGGIVHVVGGDYKQAFRRGVELARSISTAEVPGLADIVIASSYPSDLNLWQAGKALYAADLVVREGGLIILVSPCYEGVGEHGDFAELLGRDRIELERQVVDGQVADRVAGAAALAVALVRDRAEVWLVSEHVSDADLSRMKMRRFHDLQDAVDQAIMSKGPHAKILLLHEATEIVPVAPLAFADA
jgi:nickel-dependent lactate racemase